MKLERRNELRDQIAGLAKLVHERNVFEIL
jgi:hypothetical protein